MIKLGVKSFELTREAEEEWTKEILAKSRANPEFSEMCSPGYYNGGFGEAMRGPRCGTDEVHYQPRATSKN